MNTYYMLLAAMMVIFGLLVIYIYRSITIIQTLFLFTAVSTLFCMIQEEEDPE